MRIRLSSPVVRVKHEGSPESAAWVDVAYRQDGKLYAISAADGKQLWVSGRYDREVYVFDTEKGTLIKRIPVGIEPHGLCYWPQPGRFSVGHTGNMR